MPRFRFTAARLTWLAAYVVTLGMTAWGMVEVRRWALPELAGDAARGDWQDWREEAAEQSAAGPVRRDPPKSDEPPALILLRDFFPAILGMGLLFSSLLFGTVLLAVRAFRPVRRRGLDLDEALRL